MLRLILGFAIALAAPAAAQQAASAPPPGLLIVAPEDFHPALEPFVTARHARLPTTLVALEAALAADGVDDPERLKRHLFARHRDDAIRYVLLVGDADVLPVRYMVLDRVTEPAFDTAFYPSDLYYADLCEADGGFESWNAHAKGHHAGYFGEVRGEKHKDGPIDLDQVDYLPDVAVGRWPVSTPAEVAVVVAKTLTFDRWLAAGADTRPRAGFAMVHGWIDARPHMAAMADRFTDWDTRRLFYGDDSNAPTEDRLVALLNAGTHLVLHAGHGSDHTWEHAFGPNAIARLDNAQHPAVIVSAGCSTARFATLPPYEPYVDVSGIEHEGTVRGEVFTAPPPPPAPYQQGRFNPPGLGERLVRAGPTGAVAYIGCNTGSQPCALTLLDGFARAVATRESPTLGDCWNDAIRHYVAAERLRDLQPTESWYPPSVFFQGMKFMVFGDPSLRLP